MKALLEYVINNKTEVLHFLKSRYPLYHNSNLFLRDVQFGLILFFQKKRRKVRNRDAEKIARGFLEHLQKANVVHQLDRQTWWLSLPEFQLNPVSKPAGSGKVPSPHQAL